MKIQTKGFLLILLLCSQLILSIAQQTGKTEEFEYQADVGRVMDIIINSLYTHREIFLRELISNGSDALDKIRYLSIQKPDILGEKKELEIRIEYDEPNKALIIADTGIGMTKNELIQNLGTIAKSGTTDYIEAVKSGNLNIIGQFGVGFYSAFLVASKVQVTSKHDGDDQYVWESSAASSFTIQKDPAGNTLKRGTKIILYLKSDANEFGEEKTLTETIKKYSEFINFPIYLKVMKEVSKEVPDGEAEKKQQEEEAKKEEEKSEEEKKSDDEFQAKEVTDGEKEKPKKKTKTIKEKVPEWKLMNDNKAIWQRKKEDIEDEEYIKFYKALTKDYDDPRQWIHFKAEGEVEFTSILFVPSRAPHDLFENYYSQPSQLKLYVRRVLISEQFEDLMPKYLNFIKGIVDSDDIPIHVSREQIQQLKMLKVMSRKLVRKALEMLRKMSEAEFQDEDEDEEEEDEEEEEEEEEGKQESTKKETEKKDGEVEKEQKKAEKEEQEEADEKEEQEEAEVRKLEKKNKYIEFWREFGKNIKLGIIEDSSNRPKLAKITRWCSSHNMTELITFDQYLERAKSGQDSIYYLAGESKETIMKHPTLQKLLKKGYEVLLLDDPIDEFTFQHLTEYEKKKLVNVGKGDFKFPDEDDIERKKFKKLKKMFKPLTEWWKNLLSNDLESVIVSQRLVEDPCVLVSSEYGYSANMERISKAQAYSAGEKTNPYSNAKKILEINPSHPAIKELFERVKEDPDSETEELAKILYEGASINSGYGIKDPEGFSKRFYRLYNGALGIPKDSQIKEIEVDLTEEDAEDEDDKDKDKEGKRRGGLDEQDLDDEDETELKKNKIKHQQEAQNEQKKNEEEEEENTEQEQKKDL